MTEAYEVSRLVCGRCWLVRVRAQVMCRDDATGGWVALGGGGLANVMVGKRPLKPALPAEPSGTDEIAPRPNHTHTTNYEYFIYGKRISDNTVVLSCTIKKDFQYNKVMPTFHHWVTDEKRFGLTFQTAADARAFDKGVRTAIEELLDGLGGAWPSLHIYKKLNTGPRQVDEENQIFECLHLPSDSRSSSENSTVSRSHKKDISQTPILSAITLPSNKSSQLREGDAGRGRLSEFNEEKEKLPYLDDSADAECPYVNLSAVHDYTYPAVSASNVSDKSSPNSKTSKHDSATIMRMQDICEPRVSTLLDKKPPSKYDAFGRVRCRHCHEWYVESSNRAGSCEYAPDGFKTCINTVSCIKCAQCVLYHCMSDPDGDHATHPCACYMPDETCSKRWFCVAILSLFVPCLWCYMPLHCAHEAARACHVAGGEHAPAHHDELK